MRQGWFERVVTQQASATLKNNYTTAQSVLAGSLGILGNKVFEVPGSEIIMRAAGAISNIVTSPGTIQFLLKLGAITVWDSGAIQLSTVAHTLQPFILEVPLTVQVVGPGTTAKLLGVGRLHGLSIARTSTGENATTDATIVVPQSNPAQGGGFDSGVAQTIDLFVAFSNAQSGNGIRVDQFSIDSVN